MIPPDCQPPLRLLLNAKYESVVAAHLSGLWSRYDPEFDSLRLSFIRPSQPQLMDYFLMAFGPPLAAYKNRCAIWSFSKIEPSSENPPVGWKSFSARSTVWATVRNEVDAQEVLWEFDKRSHVVKARQIFREVVTKLKLVNL